MITQEESKFLRDLQQELKTQDNDLKIIAETKMKKLPSRCCDCDLLEADNGYDFRCLPLRKEIKNTQIKPSNCPLKVDELTELIDKAIVAEKALKTLLEISNEPVLCKDCKAFDYCDKLDKEEFGLTCIQTLVRWAMEEAREQE